jgi:hypothetical protein
LTPLVSPSRHEASFRRPIKSRPNIGEFFLLGFVNALSTLVSVAIPDSYCPMGQ